MHLLRIDASARIEDSVTRRLADELVAGLREKDAGLRVTQRELADGLPLLNEIWVNANFTDADQRSAEQREALALSDELIAELRAADAVALSSPVYNFGVPAVLKAWVDLVTRARETFRYGAQGPEGLLKDRPVYLVMASGGTAIGSEIDFAGRYLQHILGFIGIRDVRVIAADQMMVDEAAAWRQARAQMQAALSLWRMRPWRR